MSDSDLIAYYSRRAAEYEQIYLKPERQEDLAALTRLLQAHLTGHDILEVACGTGYWTERLAPVARSLVATDASSEVLKIARAKVYPVPAREGPQQGPVHEFVRGYAQPGFPVPDTDPNGAGPRVRFEQADAFALEKVAGRFTAAFAGFWWSHLRRREIPRFLQALHERVGSRCRVVVTDNRYIEGSSTPVTRVDAEGDSYQLRRLTDGSEHEVLKNFPSPAQLRSALERLADEIEIHEMSYYWCMSYLVRT